MSIEEVKHANAQGVLESVKSGLARRGFHDWQNKLVGFGSDGAAVNLGKRAGVAVRLTEEIPHLVTIHCVAHRLELGVLDAMKHHPYIQSVVDLLKLIHKHYHYSPKALRELKEISSVMEEKVLKPTNLEGTRWIPHVHRALETLVKSYSVILTHFEHIVGSRAGTADVQGRARHIMKKLKSYKFLCEMFFMLDLLSVVAQLSKRFQADKATVSTCVDALSTCHTSLIGLSLEPGENLAKFSSQVKDGRYQGTVLTDVEDRRGHREKFKDLAEGVSEHLSQRLGNIETNEVIGAIARITTISDWPRERNQLAVFGNEDIRTLCSHFSSVLTCVGCDVNVLRTVEWPDLREYVSKRRDQPGNEVIASLYTDKSLSERFANILFLLEGMITLPVSTSVVERGFSCMKRIKSDWRSSLSNDMLRKLLLIVLDGPEFFKYDARSAVNKWWSQSQRKRRPGSAPQHDHEMDNREDNERID